MIPHGRKDSKFDSKSKLYQLNELAELYNCNNVMFFEARKGQDLYLHMSKVPNGPTVKFHVQNRESDPLRHPQRIPFPLYSALTRARAVHTMEELHFAGNCLKGSRPILSFDASFDTDPYLQVIRELFLHTFGVPQGARKSKPFVDHVMGFTYLDGKVWVRNYQVNEVEATQKEGEEDAEAEAEKAKQKKTKAGGRDTDISLVEIGPRFVLTPIVIQEGSFGGPLIYENKQFVSPNQVRADLRKQKLVKHSGRAEQTGERVARRRDLGLRADGVPKPRDELDTKMLFA